MPRTCTYMDPSPQPLFLFCPRARAHLIGKWGKTVTAFVYCTTVKRAVRSAARGIYFIMMIFFRHGTRFGMMMMMDEYEWIDDWTLD
jgi:hypothetical protein